MPGNNTIRIIGANWRRLPEPHDERCDVCPPHGPARYAAQWHVKRTSDAGTSIEHAEQRMCVACWTRWVERVTRETGTTPVERVVVTRPPSRGFGGRR